MSNPALNKLYADYQRNAKGRGVPFLLSREQFAELVVRPCTVCGTVKDKVRRRNSHTFEYTGLDRVVNEEGYAVSNVVPCCTRCNWAKGAESQEHFRAWLYRAYHRTFGILRNRRRGPHFAMPGRLKLHVAGQLGFKQRLG